MNYKNNQINQLWKYSAAASLLLTMLSALSVVSSREAAKHPSSVEPPSHIPANAAMLLVKQKQIIYVIR